MAKRYLIVKDEIWEEYYKCMLSEFKTIKEQYKLFSEEERHMKFGLVWAMRKGRKTKASNAGSYYDPMRVLVPVDKE